MMIFDSQLSFWKFKPNEQKWIIDGIMDKMKQDYLPEHIDGILKKCDVKYIVCPLQYQSRSELTFLTELFKTYPLIAGGSAFLDHFSEDLSFYIEECKNNSCIVSFSLSFTRKDITSERMELAFRYIGKSNFPIEIYCHQLLLDKLLVMLSKFPDNQFIIVHGGAPDIRDGRILKWEKAIKGLAALENVFCKFSGFTQLAHWIHWQANDIDPYMELLFEYFSADQVLFGSDWPKCLLASSYEEQLDYFKDYISSNLDKKTAEAFWYSNARNLYQGRYDH